MRTFRPALIGFLPALAAALLLAILLAGRLTPAVPISPGIDLPGIGITPTVAPAAPAEPANVAPALENSPITPTTSSTPASPTTMPGTGITTGPSATAAPGVKGMPGPGRLMGDQEDSWPYPNLPNGKGPFGQ
jgi:hypothetical protein